MFLQWQPKCLKVLSLPCRGEEEKQ
uniref:Uncharacterized protein n=1 Tax=Anguilla anguilla TaxID=7936 RepID=A0A0E9V925_ANGAN